MVKLSLALDSQDYDRLLIAYADGGQIVAHFDDDNAYYGYALDDVLPDDSYVLYHVLPTKGRYRRIGIWKPAKP